MIFTLPIGIYFAYKYPDALNKIVYYFLLCLCILAIGEALLGIVMAATSWTTDIHRILAHGVVIVLGLTVSLSLPACVGCCVRTRNAFGFREIPSGLLALSLIQFCTFTAYLKPDDPGHEAAYLRFIVFHYFISNILMFLALFRWFYLMRKWKRGKGHSRKRD